VTLTLHGIGVSKGIAIGKVYILNHQPIEVNECTLSKRALEGEIIRFEEALTVARRQLQEIRDNIPKDKDNAVDLDAFVEAHLMMLEDSLLAKDTVNLIRIHQCNAEWALKLQCENIMRIFAEMEDPYLRSRKNDVEQVVNRVLRILRGYTEINSGSEDALINAIVLADDLSPADTLHMQHYGVQAFATEFGGTTSHTAILARSLGIPAIVGLHKVRAYVRHDDTVIVEGEQGVILISPDENTLSYYQQQQQREKRHRTSLNKIKTTPIATQDGIPITLHINIELPEDVEAVKRVGGDGIGLFRTEFLFMNRSSPPDEEEHFEAYVKVVRALRGGVVTIRTLDLGADKQVDSKRFEKNATTNPALGLRAIRLCLKDPKLFKPQLRAILRASAEGNVRMMIPMVSGLTELIQTQHLVAEVSEELRQKSQKFDPHLSFGAMVEVPSMAICVDLFAPYIDFLSIGTNDLIQYTLALDRVDDSVNYLYDPLHPAVLRLIKTSIQAATRANKHISMCGEMASDSRYIKLLLGLGLRSFSVNPAAFLEVKQIINRSHIQHLSRLAEQVLKASSSTEIAQLLEEINR